MAIATNKKYFYPEKGEKKKPKQRYVEQDGRKFMEKDYGWGATLVDPNAAGDAAKYKETAQKLLRAQGAEAEARIANPEQALKAQKQEADLANIATLTGLKEQQTAAGIKATLSELGLDEKPGGGMESVKGMSPELKAKLGINSGTAYSGPPEVGQSQVQEMFPALESFKQSSMLGQPAYNTTNTYEGGAEVSSQAYGDIIKSLGSRATPMNTLNEKKQKTILDKLREQGMLTEEQYKQSVLR